MVAAEALAFPLRREPGFLRSFFLAALMHALLVAVLLVGVRFQSYVPTTVEVELWEAPPPAPLPEVKPEPPPPPPPKTVEPEKPVPKPDIAVQKKPEPKPKPKPKAEPPKRDLANEKRMREQLAQEQKAMAEQQRAQDEQRRERELKALIAKREADARARGLAAWQDKIRGKIRGNIILPRDIAGNPEALFDVSLLPTGEVLSVKQTRSSGNPAYDEAVYRAILKSSPLPKPDNPSLFERRLELRFRPFDK